MFGACYYPWYRSEPIEFDISFDADLIFTDSDFQLSKITTANLDKIGFELGITWMRVLAKLIVRPGGGYYNWRPQRAWSILIVGEGEQNTVWQYWRKETDGRAAGQTLLYKEGRHPFQATSVLEGKRHPKW